MIFDCGVWTLCVKIDQHKLASPSRSLKLKGLIIIFSLEYVRKEMQSFIAWKNDFIRLFSFSLS